MVSVRTPAVAGQFYPDESGALDAAVTGYLARVETDRPAPKALIAPHAGFIYSGAIAASAYALLKAAHDTITRVVLLGPAHRVAFRGLAAPSVEQFATPLGPIPLDGAAIARALALPQVTANDEAHRQEHSLEVQLPFLQRVLDDFTLVPLVVGAADVKDVAEVIDALWGGPETVIVISSDLSHYLDYDAARKLDARTCQAIEQMRPDDIGREQACGRLPIKGLLTLAKARGMTVTTLDLRNSGDTAGPRDRVVGYGAWSVDEAEDATTATLARHGKALRGVAAASIVHGLNNDKPLTVKPALYPAELRAMHATFVTLKLAGKLRGCIGKFQAVKPMVVDVADNAFSAAFKDPRFKPLTMAEFDRIALSISVLSPPRAMRFAGEDDLLGQLRPGVDGVILSCGKKRGLFLPQVWEGLPEPRDFMTRLKKKAGLKADFWSDDIKAHRFTAISTPEESG